MYQSTKSVNKLEFRTAILQHSIGTVYVICKFQAEFVFICMNRNISIP